MVAKKQDRSSRKVIPEETAEKKFYHISTIKQFASEVRSEYGKIAWPERKVTMGSTGVVIVLVVIISLYLGAVDLFIGKLVSYILN